MPEGYLGQKSNVNVKISDVLKRVALKLLYVLFIPMVLLSLFVHVISGAIRRVWAIFVKSKPDFSSPNTGAHSEVNSNPSLPSILPVPSVGNYLGDIFGYFTYLAKGGPNSLGKRSQLIGKSVFSINVGTPVVVCGDHQSAEVLFANVDNLTQAHVINLSCTRQSKPIFITHGLEARNARQLIVSLLPPDESKENFQAAMKSIVLMMDGWAELSETKLHKMSVEEAVGDLVCNFAGCLLLGSSLDQSLIGKVFPTPNYLPRYPTIPFALLPSFHNMQSALTEMFEQAKQSDNWEQVASKAAEVGLSEREAFEQLFTAITFNAAGLSNSLLNGILLVALMQDRGEQLLEDDAHLTSFVWELLRHNGPTLMMRLTEDTMIKTAEGTHHKLRSGTNVLCSTSMAQRDESVWKDPSIFRSRRFVEISHHSISGEPSGQVGEPLPTLGFGCPVHRSNRSEKVSNNHQCPFLPLAPVFLKSFLRLLIGNYQWSFEDGVLANVNVLKNDDG
ncbi:MAG: hypothetical protein ACJ0DF_06460, partial [Paracoccaceae bacterium]